MFSFSSGYCPFYVQQNTKGILSYIKLNFNFLCFINTQLEPSNFFQIAMQLHDDICINSKDLTIVSH